MTGFTKTQVERPVNGFIRLMEIHPEFNEFIDNLCADGETIKEAIWQARST